MSPPYLYIEYIINDQDYKRRKLRLLRRELRRN
jgi:hypothetical protein